MRRGAHAAADGSFGRSAAAHAGRGAVLLFVSFLLGIVLLQSSDHSTPIGSSEAQTPVTKPTTTTPPSVTSTTAAPPPAHDPKTVKVLSANGTTVNGIGDKLRRRLLTAGYDALLPVTSPSKLETTQIFFTAGFQPDAQAIATALGVPLSQVQALPAKPPVTVGTANVLVIAGKDLVNALTSTSSTTASTTARPSTATTAKSSTSTTAKSATTSTTAKP